jgi:hypothetical protein
MIWLVILSLAFVVPFWKLLPQYGINSWWSVLAVVPIFALALLYIMAFVASPKGGQQ